MGNPNYARYRQMLEAELAKRGSDTPFVSNGSSVNRCFSENVAAPSQDAAPFVSNVSSVNKCFSEDEQEAFLERAAIMEYDGGLSREEAEQAAKVIVLDEFRCR